MTTTVRAYLDDVERAFLLSPVVRSLQVREREERLQEGFIRLSSTFALLGGIGMNRDLRRRRGRAH